jgi:sugar phosphate isomerase/epimerase
MKLGVFTAIYRDLSFEEALDKAQALGLDAVEIGTGNVVGSFHCDVDALLADAGARRAYLDAVESRGLTISALSQHGNPLHPDETIARSCHETWRKTARLAELLEVPIVVGFSGCPGDHDGARFPNWATCGWPAEFLEMLDWQWNERVIPYWTEEAEFARSCGVKFAVEMHPGMVAYNPETLLRLRAAAGDSIGANFDPSHLLWQGIDPVEAIRQLAAADALFYVHAKDTYVDAANVRRNGVLDTKPLDDVLQRSWIFRTVGYGAGDAAWRDIMSALATVGYDAVVSIEHEDGLASVDEGLSKAVSYLRDIMFSEPAVGMWWAE